MLLKLIFSRYSLRLFIKFIEISLEYFSPTIDGNRFLVTKLPTITKSFLSSRLYRNLTNDIILELKLKNIVLLIIISYIIIIF